MSRAPQKKVRIRRAALIPNKPLPSGSIVQPGKKTIICGICGAEHKNYRRPKNAVLYKDKGFCGGCWPWARVALRREHDDGPSAERDAIYTKIREIRRTLEGGAKLTPKGAQMPFCVVAKEWDERNEQRNLRTRDTQLYNVKLLSFHFGVMPIGDITLEMGMEFRRFLLDLPPQRGAERGTMRSELSVNQTLGVLRRVFSYACDRGWLRANPFPVGGDFTPSRRVRKPTPLVTVDEEHRLLSACVGDLAYLQEILICLSDSGMYESDRQRLRWADVDLGAGLIKGTGRPMRMTPRLRSAMQALWDRSGRDKESLVWGSRNIKKDLGRARLAAQVQGLHINHFRPTAAWRMAQAGQGFEQIADALGCKDFNYLRQYLEPDPDAAGRESGEPGFEKFLEQQFGVSANGGGKKNRRMIESGSTRKVGRPRKFTDEEAFKAIDQLGPRVSVSSLARTLECTRPTVNDWVHDQGYSTLPELVQARRFARGGV